MPEATAKPGQRVRVRMPHATSRLMRQEAAARVLMDVASQLRFRLTLENGTVAETADGVVIKPLPDS
jgi:hypothetical protein